MNAKGAFMSKFLYLECLDCKETSRPVGPVDHPYVVEDIRNQWVSGFIAPHVIANWGCNSDLTVFTHEIACLGMTKTNSNLNTSNAEDMF